MYCTINIHSIITICSIITVYIIINVWSTITKLSIFTVFCNITIYSVITIYSTRTIYSIIASNIFAICNCYSTTTYIMPAYNIVTTCSILLHILCIDTHNIEGYEDRYSQNKVYTILLQHDCTYNETVTECYYIHSDSNSMTLHVVRSSLCDTVCIQTVPCLQSNYPSMSLLALKLLKHNGVCNKTDTLG